MSCTGCEPLGLSLTRSRLERCLVAPRIGFHHARIDREPLSLVQPGGHAGRKDALEYVTKQVEQTTYKRGQTGEQVKVKSFPRRPCGVWVTGQRQLG